jgi:hypothetical protein
MSDTEKAIKHFETLQKRYTTQHNGTQCMFVKIAISAMKEKYLRESKPDTPEVQYQKDSVLI